MDKRRYNNRAKLRTALARVYGSNLPCLAMVSYLGTTREDFVRHIDSYLLSGMTKENFGKTWGLDHIVPVDLFDISSPDELKLCYNYNNLMPMFLRDNKLKGASVHFSLEKLRSMYTNVVIEELIRRCEQEIDTRYKKYML